MSHDAGHAVVPGHPAVAGNATVGGKAAVTGSSAFPPGQFAIAHRAGNDLAALRRAEAVGVPMIEADLRVWRAHVDLRHHKSLGPLPVLWDRHGRDWALRRGATQLALPELLETVGPESHLLLDLKGFDLRVTQRLLEAIAEHPGLPERTVACARNWRLLHALRESELPIGVVKSVRHPRNLRALLEHAGEGDIPDGVSIHVGLLDAHVVKRLTTLGMRVLTWPVNTGERARLLQGWGVSGLISDEFETVQAFLQQDDNLH